MHALPFIPDELKTITPFYETLYYIGNLELLKQRKVAIVGSRKPSQYSRVLTSQLSFELSKSGITIVSGAAMGVDALAHNHTIDFNTIAVVANGLDIRYPRINQGMIQNIENKGLMLSGFPQGHKARGYNFVQRNEMVVALSEALIITQADINSGSLTSAKFALKHNKPIYVLPHRLGESLGTQRLLEQNLAAPIYDVSLFANSFNKECKKELIEDELLTYVKQFPTYDDALDKFGAKLFEYELSGKIEIRNGLVIAT